MNNHVRHAYEVAATAKLTMADLVGQDGISLSTLTAHGPTLVVFLRHLGCVFCRQTLADLREARPALAAHGIGIALIHMSSDRQAELIFRLYGLDDVARFANPDRSLYQAFGLRRVTMRELMSTQLFKRGLEACIHERHIMNIPRGDPLQMPGVFLVERGYVLAAFVHDHPWDRPRYQDFAATSADVPALSLAPSA